MSELRIKIYGKEKTQDALEKMKLDAKDMEKELDRTLEAFKKMELEQKLDDAIKNLDKLAEEQKKLAEKTENKQGDHADLKKQQEELNKKFDDLKKDIDDMEKKNAELEDPMKMPDTQKQEEEIKKDMEESGEQLDQKQNKKASKSQKSAAQKMEEMSQKMQQAKAEEEQEGEDEQALRQILENLLAVSFAEEELMNKIKVVDRANPQYLKLIQQQKKIKDDAKMIEDSLFALSKRQPKIEKPEAIKNIDAIIKASNGVMIARGDLGVEMPKEKLPTIQKMIVAKCIQRSRPVIVATQMMASIFFMASGFSILEITFNLKR